ncbi:MAG: molybdenum cofactor guanylyltransferase MobA [Steroidobacteraceae bacterium]
MITVAKNDITGLILAGGRGSRMGGVDKGLQLYEGRPLAQRALQRLHPQVRQVMVNANRNQESYRAMNVPVWPDEVPDYAGPLAGMLAGLAHCDTPFLATAPCDTPNFPLDLVARLAHGLQSADADIAVAYTRMGSDLFPQPVFCLMKISLKDALAAFIAAGERKTGFFARGQRNTRVVFDDDAQFFNINTLSELEQSQRPAI